MDTRLEWFERLVEEGTPEAIRCTQVEELPSLRAWATEAEAALRSVFPPAHTLCRNWDQVLASSPDRIFRQGAYQMLGILRTAAALIREGRLSTLTDEIRAETATELLHQAEELVERNWLAAAAVIAGGALETHLSHLIAKHGLTVTGHGAISAYNQSVARERKAGNSIYSTADHDQVESWGKLRNKAAHTPGEFDRGPDEITLMIEGIRQFVARTA